MALQKRPTTGPKTKAKNFRMSFGTKEALESLHLNLGGSKVGIIEELLFLERDRAKRTLILAGVPRKTQQSFMFSADAEKALRDLAERHKATESDVLESIIAREFQEQTGRKR